MFGGFGGSKSFGGGGFGGSKPSRPMFGGSRGQVANALRGPRRMPPGQQMRAAGGPVPGMRGASSFTPGFANRPDTAGSMGGGMLGAAPPPAPAGGIRPFGMPPQQPTGPREPPSMSAPTPAAGWMGGTQIGALDRGGGIVGGTPTYAPREPSSMGAPTPTAGWMGGTQIGALDRGGGIVGMQQPIDPRKMIDPRLVRR